MCIGGRDTLDGMRTLLILTLTLIFLKFPQNLQWERKSKRDRECEEDLPEDIVLLAQGGKKNT